MKDDKKGNYIIPMVQTTINVPKWVVTDLDKLAQTDGLSKNTFTRKWIINALNKEKAKRGWL